MEGAIAVRGRDMYDIPSLHGLRARRDVVVDTIWVVVILEDVRKGGVFRG